MNIQQLSPHFSITELTRTGTGLPNMPTSPVIVRNLQAVCINILEPIRENFNKAVIVHSGYRCPALNAAVGGSQRSQHCSGEAADFHVDGYSVLEVALWVSEHLDFDQLILENFIPHIKASGWVHCSYGKRLRNQELTKFKGSRKYYPGINSQVPAEFPRKSGWPTAV